MRSLLSKMRVPWFLYGTFRHLIFNCAEPTLENERPAYTVQHFSIPHFPQCGACSRTWECCEHGMSLSTGREKQEEERRRKKTKGEERRRRRDNWEEDSMTDRQTDSLTDWLTDSTNTSTGREQFTVAQLPQRSHALYIYLFKLPINRPRRHVC